MEWDDKEPLTHSRKASITCSSALPWKLGLVGPQKPQCMPFRRLHEKGPCLPQIPLAVQLHFFPTLLSFTHFSPKAVEDNAHIVRLPHSQSGQVATQLWSLGWKHFDVWENLCLSDQTTISVDSTMLAPFFESRHKAWIDYLFALDTITN